MSGQINTADSKDIEFNELCNKVRYYLDKNEFEEYIGITEYWLKFVANNKLKMTVTFNSTNRQVCIVVSYRNKNLKGAPEIFNGDKLDRILEFIKEFDY